MPHPDGVPYPHTLWQAWNADPIIIAALVVAAVAYALGVRRVWASAKRGGGLRRWQPGAFAAGITVLAVALLSPLDAVAEALFSAHMIQHLLLMLVAPPLLVLGSPVYAWLWALPPRGRRAAGRLWLTASPVRIPVRFAQRPFIAWLLQLAVLALWHVPYFYDAAVANALVHAAQHASYVGVALLFWSSLIEPSRQLRHAYGAALLYVFAAAMQGGALGALLTFGGRAWYASHLESAPAWSLTAVEDQQIAGAIMWVPGGLVYLLALAALMLLWLRAAERRVAQAEARQQNAPWTSRA